MLAAVLAFAGVAAIINVTPGLDMMLVLRTSVSGGRRAGLAAAIGVNTGCLVWGIATAAGLSVLLTASHVAFDVVRIAGAAYLTWLGSSALWHARRKKPDRATPNTATPNTATPNTATARTAASGTAASHIATSSTATSHTATPGTTASHTTTLDTAATQPTTEPAALGTTPSHTTTPAPATPGMATSHTTTSDPAAPDTADSHMTTPGTTTPAATEPTGRVAAFRSGLGTNLLNPKAGIFYMSLLPQFIPHGAQVFGSTLLLTGVDVAELSVLYFVVSGAAAAMAGRLAKTSFRRRMEQVSGVVFLGFAASLVWERS